MLCNIIIFADNQSYGRKCFTVHSNDRKYFRSQAEMAHTCRGTINLAGASLESEDSCNFVISNGGAQVFILMFMIRDSPFLKSDNSPTLSNRPS